MSRLSCDRVNKVWILPILVSITRGLSNIIYIFCMICKLLHKSEVQLYSLVGYPCHLWKWSSIMVLVMQLCKSRELALHHYNNQYVQNIRSYSKYGSLLKKKKKKASLTFSFFFICMNKYVVLNLYLWLYCYWYTLNFNFWWNVDVTYLKLFIFIVTTTLNIGEDL